MATLIDQTFLTEAEIDFLTGISRGKKGYCKQQIQAEWLRKNGIAFFLNHRQKIVIARAALHDAHPTTHAGWMPDCTANR